MHMLSKIFNTLEKIASVNARIVQAHDTMEKAAATVTRGLRALLKARKASVARAMRKNPKLTRQQALDAFYKRYGLQVGKGGKISAIEGAKLNNRALAKQREWLDAMRRNKKISRDIRDLRVLDPTKRGMRLMELSKKYNFSERGGDFIVAQKPILRNGKMVQNNFRLNRKRMLRSKLKNSGPGNNPPAPGPTPPGPTPPGPTPPGPIPPGPTPPGPTPKSGVEPGPTPKPGPDGGQYGPTSPAPTDAPVGKGLFGNNWWKYGLAGAGGFVLGRSTAPDQQPQQPMAYNGVQY